MDLGNPKQKRANPNPVQRASYCSKLLFLWLLPFLRKGTKRTLSADDIYDVLDEHEAGAVGNQLEKEWTQQQKSKPKGNDGIPRLFCCLFKIHGTRYTLLVCSCIFNECVIKPLQPLFLRWLIQSFDYDSDSSDSYSDRYVCAAGLSLSVLAYSILVQVHNHQLLCMAVGMKAALSALVYRKSLTLSAKALQQNTNTGQVVNLLSTDASRINAIVFTPHAVVSPVQFSVFGYLLYREMGSAAFVAVGFLVLLLPLNFLVYKLSENLRGEISSRTDARAKFMSEIINGIRVVKMYAWEYPMSALIHRLRKQEIKALTKLWRLLAVFYVFDHGSAKIITILTILAYAYGGHALSADKIFYCVTIVNLMLQGALFFLPMAVSDLADIFVSTRRLEAFLLLGEHKVNHEIHEEQRSLLMSSNESKDDHGPHPPSITMKLVNASWVNGNGGTGPTLEKVNLDFSGNRLVMIVGPVGAGKSSLLNVLISELPITSGSYTLHGRLAYDSQDPWLFSSTVRQNILFGRPYDRTRYLEVVHVCGLEEDIAAWPQGHDTMVGERGVSLSGGQKARLNLARCLYQQADIYLMDDPLSAVDAHVSRHIFEKCVMGYLSEKLRILVTHQLQYLPYADHVLVLKEGGIIAQGPYQDLCAQNVDFMGVTTTNTQQELQETFSSSRDEEKSAKEPSKEHEPLDTEEEQMAGGHVTLKTYLAYFRSSGPLLNTFLILFGLILMRLAVNGSEFWLARWTDAEEENTNAIMNITNVNRSLPSQPSDEENVQVKPFDRNAYIQGYILLVTAATGLTILTTLAFNKYCLRTSKNMHDNLFKNIVRAPTQFFDRNPSGRIMNRFTKDLGVTDETLPTHIYDTVHIALTLAGVVAIVCFTNYIVLFPTCLTLAVMLIIRRYYAGPVRAIKRYEALAQSPIFSHATASIQGLATIRASNSQAILSTQFEFYLNRSSTCRYMYLSASRWFATWLELETVLYLITIIFSFFLIPSHTLGVNIGLAISSALLLNQNLQRGMRQSIEAENCMISVERVIEYSELKTEASLESAPGKKPPKHWPPAGEIRFDSVSLSYNNNAPVLKHLTFDIKPREKIGIVGRTGAGKSSIVAALFRMQEPEGSIWIDGVCINEIGLHDLRKQISIIPQDPVLFSGTARYNIDPFNQHEDNELWRVLEEVHMDEVIPSLGHEIADGGCNLSVGQRQLICLARAILRKDQILVMDEATANIDPRTDEFIQQMIRTRFADCTIITIAHRLHTVMDCDRILVLERGCVMEYDHPHLLLRDPQGVLTAMVEQVGQQGKEELYRIAAKNYQHFESRTPGIMDSAPIDHKEDTFSDNERNSDEIERSPLLNKKRDRRC